MGETRPPADGLSKSGHCPEQPSIDEQRQGPLLTTGNPGTLHCLLFRVPLTRDNCHEVDDGYRSLGTERRKPK